MSEMLLVRHAQGSFGHGDYDNLSEKGYIQSQLLAEYLVNIRFKDKVIDAVYCGTLKRQQQTADTILQYLQQHKMQQCTLKIDPRLNEYDSMSIIKTLFPVLLEDDPELENEIKKVFSDKKAFQRVFEKVMRYWVTLPHHPIIESYNDVKKRVTAALNDIAKENGRGKNIIVVTSGGIIGAIVQSIMGFDDETAMKITWQIVNTSITHIRYNENEFTVASFNFYPHLEYANDQSLKTYR